MRNMKELILNDLSPGYAPFLSDAQKLAKLHLIGFLPDDIIPILSNDYPQLRSLALQRAGARPTAIEFNNFLLRDPDLTVCTE